LHPIEEVYSSIEDQLASQNSTLNQTLSVALQNLSSSVTNATLEEFESQIDHVNMLLNNSVQAVVPTSEFDNNTAFNASVVGRLLDISGHEYEEAVANGTINEIVEYQDAQAFIYRAGSVFNSSASRINQSMASEVEEVHEFFSILNGAVINKEDPATVETTINGIIHELAEITGLSESQLVGEEAAAAEQDPIAIINNIKSLLNQLIAAYRSQDYAGAESIAIEAYLENYENVEAPIAERDQQLMEQTEVMLREELRQMITDRVPIEQIEQHVTMINANLDRAAALLQ
jgi:AAA+ ATPase superfamily predicted ATPase